MQKSVDFSMNAAQHFLCGSRASSGTHSFPFGSHCNYDAIHQFSADPSTTCAACLSASLLSRPEPQPCPSSDHCHGNRRALSHFASCYISGISFLGSPSPSLVCYLLKIAGFQIGRREELVSPWSALTVAQQIYRQLLRFSDFF